MRYDLSFLDPVMRAAIGNQTGSHRLDEPPAVEHYDRGCVLPCKRISLTEYRFAGGVTDADGTFAKSSALHEPPCDVGGSYAATMQDCNRTAVFIGFLLPEWGNVLFDSLKKLWFLRTDEGRRMLAQDAVVAYVTWGNAAPPPYQFEIWEMAGYDTSAWLHVTTPTRFHQVILPGNSLKATADETRLFSPLFKMEIERIKAAAFAGSHSGKPHDAGGKTYLTRTSLHSNKDYNEKEIEQLFREKGFDIVAPEKLSVAEQIRLMASSRTVAATEGSVSHNALFMSPGSQLIVLQKADYVNGYQHAANAVADLKVTYIRAHHSVCASKQMPWAGPFYLTVTPELKAWSGGMARKLPLLCRPSYWNYRLKNIRLLHSVKLHLYLFIMKIRGKGL